MTTNTKQLSGWIGREVLGENGDKIGKIDAVYVDDQTGTPEWLGVTTGLFGTSVSFVPLTSATTNGDAVSVPYAKDAVKEAPRVDPDETLSEQEEADLYRHYGLQYSKSHSETGLPQRSADDAMTRSEEELRVGVARQEAGRVRLRKWVETEQIGHTVPVTREQVRIEREPITEANVDQAMSGPDISEDDHEAVLYEEQVVTDKQVVPKERVRLKKDQVTEEVQVTDEVRKERIDVEGDAPTTR